MSVENSKITEPQSGTEMPADGGKKRNMLTFLLPLGIFLLMSLFLLAGLFDDPRKLESALAGKPTPEFRLPDLYDESVVWDKTSLLSEKMQGKPLLLNVWATWCPTCRAEHTYLNRLARQGIPIVGLNYKDNQALAHQWLADLKDPYQVNLMDIKGTLAMDLGVYGAPETFVIDSKGVVRYRHTGDVNQQVWDETIGPLWAEISAEYAQESGQ